MDHLWLAPIFCFTAVTFNLTIYSVKKTKLKLLKIISLPYLRMVQSKDWNVWRICGGCSHDICDIVTLIFALILFQI